MTRRGVRVFGVETDKGIAGQWNRAPLADSRRHETTVPLPGRETETLRPDLVGGRQVGKQMSFLRTPMVSFVCLLGAGPPLPPDNLLCPSLDLQCCTPYFRNCSFRVPSSVQISLYPSRGLFLSLQGSP